MITILTKKSPSIVNTTVTIHKGASEGHTEGRKERSRPHDQLGAQAEDTRRDLERVMELLEKWDIDLRVRYIPSKENPSDYFSREADKADWSFVPQVVQPLLTRWSPVTVDRFADKHAGASGVRSVT